jgi:putative ABC transport system ATP-binding protein
MIQLEQVTVVKQNTVILKNLDLTLHPGEKILLKGESGSGKSTLIKSLLFFEWFQGRILFNGEPVGRQKLCLYRRQFGYIGQTVPNFHDQVRDFLYIPTTFKSNKTLDFDTKRITGLLEKLNFTAAVLDKNFSDLSGGERQRMMILQMLMMDKPIYLLDEVTSALDKKNIRAVVSLFTAEQKRTLLSISHNEEWEDYCTRIIRLERGEIVQDTTKRGS